MCVECFSRGSLHTPDRFAIGVMSQEKRGGLVLCYRDSCVLVSGLHWLPSGACHCEVVFVRVSFGCVSLCLNVHVSCQVVAVNGNTFPSLP